VDQAYALGKAAVEMAIAGKTAIMPIIKREQNIPYTWSIDEIPLSNVANVEKKMPSEFITTDGFGITTACREYLAPLIQGEAYPPYKDGLPQYVRLQNVGIIKKLPDFKVG
jgi:6-phosphofructokinase 1